MTSAVPVTLLLALSSTASAGTFELSPGADLQGIFDTIAPGDEVILEDGTYSVNTTLYIREKLGSEALPIIIRAAEGATPVLQFGPDRATGEYAGRILQVEASTGVQLQGLTIQGDSSAATGDQTWGAVRIDASSDVWLVDCIIKEVAGTAVYLSGDTNSVVLDHTEIGRVYGGYAVYAGCSDASCFTSNLVIQNSMIHNVLSEDLFAVQLNHGSSGSFLLDNVIYNITHHAVYLGSTEGGAAHTMEGNAIWNVGRQGMHFAGSSLVRNNIVFNTGASGIVTTDPERGSFTDIIITYNTVVDNDGWAAELYNWELGAGHILANNALCNPMSYGVYMAKVVPEGTDPADIDTPGTVSTNYVCGLVDGIDEDLAEAVAGGGYADFENVELWDFYPVRDALLVDAANPAGEYYPPEVDFNGIPREGDKPDVGAYEWDGDGNPGWPIQEDFKDFEIVEEVVQGSVESGCCKDGKEQGGEALLLVPLLGLGAGLRRRRSTED